MPFAFGTPQFWRVRAAEARAIAREIADPDAARAMLDIAERYEQIAERAEKKGTGTKGDQPT